MEDKLIVALYHGRDPRAVTESQSKYGSLCRSIALRLLGQEDAEECLNDTWLAAWDRMPPEAPAALGAFLGRITRNISVSIFRRRTARKRGGLELLLSELEDCIPHPDTVEKTVESRELGRMIWDWLQTRTPVERALFVRRYWYGERLRDLARESGQGENRLAGRMLRLRRDLRTYLELRGVEV